MVNEIIAKHKLSAEDAGRVAASLDYILRTIKVDGLEALTEIHAQNPIKAHFINDEISSHIKANKPKKPPKKFFG